MEIKSSDEAKAQRKSLSAKRKHFKDKHEEKEGDTMFVEDFRNYCSEHFLLNLIKCLFFVVGH